MLNLLKRSVKKEIYLAGYEHTIEFGDNDLCERFLVAQGISREAARMQYSAMKLTFRGDRLVKVEELEEGENLGARELTASERRFAYREIPIHTCLDLVSNPAGHHQLGGEPPEGFQLPAGDLAVPLQYLGFFNRADPNFAWLPMEHFQLVCPIFSISKSALSKCSCST